MILFYLIILILSNFLIFNYEPDPSSYSLLLSKVRKDVINTILSTLTNKKDMNIFQMSEAMLKYKKDYSLNEVETTYLVYLWLGQNIIYDCDTNNIEYQFPISVYDNGKGNTIGFAALFFTFATNLNINVVPIYGKEKKSTGNNEIIQTVNSTWNAILIDNNYYLINSANGAGYCNNNEFKKNNNDFFFGTKPEFFIRTHFPDDDKWQLLKDKITFDKFISWPLITYRFYMLGFQTLSPDNDLDVNYGAKVVLTYDKNNTNLFILNKFAKNRKLTKYDGYNISNGKVVIAFDGKFTSQDYFIIYANQEGPSETYYSILIYKIKK